MPVLPTFCASFALAASIAALMACTCGLFLGIRAVVLQLRLPLSPTLPSPKMYAYERRALLRIILCASNAMIRS